MKCLHTTWQKVELFLDTNNKTEKIIINKIILSSSSEARKKLLQSLKLSFKVFEPNVQENPEDHETPQNLVRRISMLKAEAAYKKNKGNFIIAADTILYARKTFFHKTTDKDIAYKNLKLLSGRRHCIYTGLTIIDEKNKISFFLTKTKIKFKSLTVYDIENYLKLEEWKNKTGSYAIQGYGASFVSFLSGSYSGAVGLPLDKLYNILKSYKLI